MCKGQYKKATVRIPRTLSGQNDKESSKKQHTHTHRRDGVDVMRITHTPAYRSLLIGASRCVVAAVVLCCRYRFSGVVVALYFTCFDLRRLGVWSEGVTTYHRGRRRWLWLYWTNAAAVAAAAASVGAGIVAAGKSVGAPAGGAGGAAETSRIVWFAASSVQHVCRIAAHALQDLYMRAGRRGNLVRRVNGSH